MAAPAHNNHNPTGRPRRLDREIERLSEAAQHARALLEQRHLAALMGEEPCACSKREMAASVEHLIEIEHHLAALRVLAEPIISGRKRRRSPLLDPWAQAAAQAAIALDRMLPDDGPRQ